MGFFHPRPVPGANRRVSMLAVQSACICGRAALTPERVRLAGKNESAPVTVAVLEDAVRLLGIHIVVAPN